MPEGYTHALLGTTAAQNAGYQVHNRAAFLAGTQGPDIFFSFEGWKSSAKRRYDLKGLGNRMHEDRTGLFLQALAAEAKTPNQLDYFMGFLSHYVADTTVHPYVCAVTKKGEIYGRKNGHGLFEIALDSHLYQQKTGKHDFSVNDFSPKLIATPLAEIVAQLARAIEATYGLKIPFEYITDAVFHNRAVRSIFSSRFGFKRLLFWLVEPAFGGRGTLTAHVHPRRLRGITEKEEQRNRSLPNPWQDPVTGQVHGEMISELLTRAVDRTALLYTALLHPKKGADFWALVGSNDYVTGTQTEISGIDSADVVDAIETATAAQEVATC